MRADKLAMLFLLAMTATFGQTDKEASVTFGVVTSFGAPLPGGEVHIDGQSVHKTITIKGRTTVTLPYGAYRLTSEASPYYWAFERTVDVIVPKAFVLVARARKESFAISGEGTQTPYTVHGTVAPGFQGEKVFARIRGLYLPTTAESEVDGHGGFNLAVRFQGTYVVEIIDGKSIRATRTIRLDETKERPVRVDFASPSTNDQSSPVPK